MRPIARSFGAMAILWIASSAIAASAISTDTSVAILPYPGAVALSQSVPGKWVYKAFPTFLPLYIFDGDPAGKSSCDKVCTAIWPIIAAKPTEKPMGQWTIVKRDDGRLQWAYKNKPVYTYFEDGGGEAMGIGKDRDWFLDSRAIVYLKKLGVETPALPDMAEPRMDTVGKMTASLLEL